MMWVLGGILILATSFSYCLGDASELETFLASSARQLDTNSSNKQEEQTDKVTNDELILFMKRAGLLPSSDDSIDSRGHTRETLSALGNNINQQNQLLYIQPQSSQSSKYASPLPQQAQSVTYSNSQQQQQQLSLPQQVQLRNFAQQRLRAAQMKATNSNANPTYANQKNVVSALSSEPKSATKNDRQGLYDYDSSHGFDGGYGGGGHGGHDGYSAGGYSEGGHEGYSGGHYNAPHVYKNVHVPAPSVAIKIDPLGFLAALLQGIPKPLLNLNGKVFFGVELGKGIGVGKAVGGHHPAPHYGGGGKVITLG